MELAASAITSAPFGANCAANGTAPELGLHAEEFRHAAFFRDSILPECRGTSGICAATVDFSSARDKESFKD